ncbi:hypothetical protein M3Y99_00165800 [Aphelenchoides fujianensis]|nr:hypothetical protein M3Y99_00165800 [Aphelenchoides fujianensis]
MRFSLVFAFCLLFLAVHSVRADEEGGDWWDRFEKGGPAVREKFDSAKQKLQDPQTHADVQQWFKEKVFPVVEQKFNEAKTFFNEEVSPEVQKIYEAAVEGSEKVKEREAQKE